MSDADIARESNDAEGYLIIDGDGDAAPDREDQVQEDFSFSVQKVGDDDGSPKRQAVNMDEIADLLNEGVEDQEPDQPDSNGLDHDGEVIVEDGIAEVKVEGVEAGVSIQWPGGDAGEGTEGVVETEDAPNTEDDGQEREETQKQEEPVLIEVNGAGEIAEDSLVDVEPVAEEKPVVQDEPEEEQQESEEDRPEIDDTPVVIDKAPEIIVDTSEDIEDQEVDDTPVVVEVDDTPVVVDTPEVDDDDDTPPEEPEIDDTPVIIDAPEPVEIEVNGNDINGEVVVEDLSPSSGNVAVDVTLGQEREEEERREVPAEDTTAKVVPVSRPKSSSSSLSDRIRAFERKQQDGHFEFDIDRQGAMEEIAATEAQTTESTPVTLEQEGLVRSSDTVEEQMAVSGGTKSILEQFKKGNVSNVETKRTIDTENVQVKSLENYQPPPKDDDEPDTHVKPQDMIDTDRDQGQTAESEPQHREGVVQGGYTEEVTRSSEGLKSLKSMWEKGGVSNIQAVKKEKIEVRSLEDVQESTSHAVAENVPAERRSDVLAGDVQEEDPGISSGLAQRIKAQFEQGKVSNIEKPKPDLERTPGSLEDYSQGDVSQSVSESTPQRRDDVIRSDIPLEEQASAAEGTRSLLSRWEKGEVEHAEVRPGEGVEDPKTLKGEYATSDPQVRDDLARESDPVDDEIPKGLARNISQTIEGSGSPTDAEFNVEVGVSESLESEPKRLPEEDDQDEAPQFEVNVEVNGNVSPTENGHGDESTPNGHYENEDEGALLDSSTEIKAVRAAADDEQDQSSILVESR